jgi:hypothetical protein
MRDPHGWIIGEIELEPVGNLLGAPRRRPAPVLASAVTPTNPPHIGARHERPIEFGDRTCQSILHVLAERMIDGKLRHFGTPSPPIGMPLSGQRAVVEIATARSRHSVAVPARWSMASDASLWRRLPLSVQRVLEEVQTQLRATGDTAVG